MASLSKISIQQLLKLVGTPKCPVLLDLRIDEDFLEDPNRIPGAIPHPFDQVRQLSEQLQGKQVVVYCQKGLKISEGSAAVLRADGVSTECLEGGHFAWRDAGLPLVPEKIIPQRDEAGKTLWVTRSRPKVDRIACAWLIRRFVDPDARFLFVSPSSVVQVAEKFAATAFDIEDVFWSHRGANCTFDTMVEEFGLQTDALQRLATIVRAADTDQTATVPQAAGLLAASLGQSRMYTDDLEQLEAGLTLYDSFYRWCRDAVDEKHDWPGHVSRAKETAT